MSFDALSPRFFFPRLIPLACFSDFSAPFILSKVVSHFTSQQTPLAAERQRLTPPFRIIKRVNSSHIMGDPKFVVKGRCLTERELVTRLRSLQNPIMQPSVQIGPRLQLEELYRHTGCGERGDVDVVNNGDGGGTLSELKEQFEKLRVDKIVKKDPFCPAAEKVLRKWYAHVRDLQRQYNEKTRVIRLIQESRFYDYALKIYIRRVKVLKMMVETWNKQKVDSAALKKCTVALELLPQTVVDEAMKKVSSEKPSESVDSSQSRIDAADPEPEVHETQENGMIMDSSQSLNGITGSLEVDHPDAVQTSFITPRKQKRRFLRVIHFNEIGTSWSIKRRKLNFPETGAIGEEQNQMMEVDDILFIEGEESQTVLVYCGEHEDMMLPPIEVERTLVNDVERLVSADASDNDSSHLISELIGICHQHFMSQTAASPALPIEDGIQRTNGKFVPWSKGVGANFIRMMSALPRLLFRNPEFEKRFDQEREEWYKQRLGHQIGDQAINAPGSERNNETTDFNELSGQVVKIVKCAEELQFLSQNSSGIVCDFESSPDVENMDIDTQRSLVTVNLDDSGLSSKSPQTLSQTRGPLKVRTACISEKLILSPEGRPTRDLSLRFMGVLQNLAERKLRLWDNDGPVNLTTSEAIWSRRKELEWNELFLSSSVEDPPPSTGQKERKRPRMLKESCEVVPVPCEPVLLCEKQCLKMKRKLP